MFFQPFRKPTIHLSFQRSYIAWLTRQIVNKVVIVQFAGETEDNFNKGLLKDITNLKTFAGGVHVKQIRAP